MDTIIPVISKISHTLGEMEELAKEHFGLQELTLTQMHYLEVMNSLQNPNITELASALQLTKPTVTVALDKLIEKEYLIKVQSDADRRTSHLHLTEKGRSINDMHEYAHRRFAELMKENLDPEELQQLLVLLEKMVEKW
ncbi:MAG: MarR family transcriptional regulator [Tenuifilaceae bacterium]|jgi:DNA-binding MarR family transcriptional regulator|nr:MarR family transcriptional regulator [Tenuifilaceae bacterium]